MTVTVRSMTLPSTSVEGRRLQPFPQTDRELFEHISRRANVRPAIPWEQIAEEIGMSVQDLLDWFLAYRSPKRAKDSLRSEGRSPALLATNPGGGQWTLGASARRHAAWRKQHDAAVKARNGG